LSAQKADALMVQTDALFKGATPAQLPVEQPHTFQLLHQSEERQRARHRRAAIAADARERGGSVNRRGSRYRVALRRKR
jgi:hypothetical protein